MHKPIPAPIIKFGMIMLMFAICKFNEPNIKFETPKRINPAMTSILLSILSEINAQINVALILPKPRGAIEYPLKNAVYPIIPCKNCGNIAKDPYKMALMTTWIAVPIEKFLSLKTLIQFALNQSALLPLSKKICNVINHKDKNKKPQISIFTFFCL